MFDDSDLPYDKIGTTHRRSMSHSVHSDAMVWVLDESYINMNLAGSLNQHTVIEVLFFFRHYFLLNVYSCCVLSEADMV